MRKDYSAYTTNASLRRALKARLYATYGERCPLTGEEATDLAEVFFWRSDYPHPDRQALLWDPCNCLIVAHRVNMDQSRETTLAMAKVILRRMGLAQVMAYVRTVGMKPRVDPEDIWE